MPLIYDCFLFFNELDLLEIRLNILSDTVDKFVLVEADRTFKNNEKPYFFAENKDRYERFLDKIIHIKINTYPETENAWDMQFYQRNQISRGITQCSADDIILISDLDEIPNPEVIKNYKQNGSGICRLKQLHYAYYLNYLRCDKYWDPAKIARYNEMKVNDYTPQDIRRRNFKTKKTINNGGWHFSFLGGIDSIKNKVQAISHPYFNNENFFDNSIEYKLRMGLDLFNRKGKRCIPVKLSNKYHPDYLVRNQEKYLHLIYPHISPYVVIKNSIFHLPYLIMRTIKHIIKSILPKALAKKIQSLLHER